MTAEIDDLQDRLAEVEQFKAGVLATIRQLKLQIGNLAVQAAATSGSDSEDGDTTP
jgi:hypothetical protein